ATPEKSTSGGLIWSAPTTTWDVSDLDPKSWWRAQYYYRARWYSPGMVSFLERDPLGYVDGSNTYQFERFSTPNFLDPTGEKTTVIFVGRGDSAGLMFLAAALTKKRQIEASRPDDDVELYEWGTDYSDKSFVLDVLKRPRSEDDKVSEIHYFGHSFRGGIAFGYGDPGVGTARAQLWNNYASSSSMTQSELLSQAIATEKGILLRHDLLQSSSWVGAKTAVRSNLDMDARMYLWGCMTTQISDFSSDPYWFVFRGLTPIRSIARELAMYLDRTVVGTSVGSKFQVNLSGSWVTPEQFHQKAGRYFGSASNDFGIFDTRLVPESGTYQEVHP
ncbi:MAG: hypothetical protein K8R59_11100, partial [Thermoanaerobaculales bacterium]|nr:hypothetical protein [Thermoanaerobaculales bacterium]